ncbi:MAG TPA: hypothetical protein VIJ92_10570 [Ginsengibacter sp.]
MKFFVILVPCLFSLTVSFSQSAKTDSIINIQVKNTLDLYDNYTGGNAPIYNGTEYIYYYFKMEGDPFFITTNLTKGWVGYSGRMYGPLKLGYDIQRNQVTIASADNFSRIVLQNDLVDSFFLDGHTFVRLQADYKQNLNTTGFYDLLHDGHLQLLARRIKIMEDAIKDNSVVRIFTEKDHFYIHKNGLYYLVTNKKEVFRLFADKQHQLKKMLRHEHIKIGRKNFETGLLRAVEFYDQLTR